MSRGRETRLPDSWRPTAEHRSRAAEDGTDLLAEVTKFRAHADEHERRAKNWNAAFTRWLITAAEYARRDASRGAPILDRQGEVLKREMERARAADAATESRLEIGA